MTNGGCSVLKCRRAGQLLQPFKEVERVFPAVTAHFRTRRQRAAHRRPFGVAEQLASQGLIEVWAGHTCGLAVGQPWHGAADGGGDAAGRAAGAAIHAVVVI